MPSQKADERVELECFQCAIIHAGFGGAHAKKKSYAVGSKRVNETAITAFELFKRNRVHIMRVWPSFPCESLEIEIGLIDCEPND